MIFFRKPVPTFRDHAVGDVVMRKVPMTIGLLAGAAAATLIAFYSVEGLGKPSDEKTPAAGARPESVLSVPVRAVVKKTVPLFLDYVGTTEAVRSVTLQAKVTGYLARQAGPDGADVKQGNCSTRSIRATIRRHSIRTRRRRQRMPQRSTTPA